MIQDKKYSQKYHELPLKEREICDNLDSCKQAGKEDTDSMIINSFTAIRAKKWFFWILLLSILAGFFLASRAETGLPDSELMEAIAASDQVYWDRDEMNREMDPVFHIPIVKPEDVYFPDPVAAIGGRKSGVFNVLLVGQDRGSERPHEGERTGSDVILLCSFLKEQKKMIMTSFQRDIFASIPGNEPEKINKAFTIGGFSLLKKTMKQNFGVHVDLCLGVDFDIFPQVVDSLGGLSLEITAEEAQEINRLVHHSTLTEGMQTMNGAQTLAYCRIRKLDSDYIRTRRQQKVMSALIHQAQSLSKEQILDTGIFLIRSVESDKNILRIFLDGIRLFPMVTQSEILHQQIPVEGTYEECIIEGRWCYRIDFNQNVKFLYDTIMNPGQNSEN